MVSNEAIEIMRMLWTGEFVDYFGSFYTVEGAKLYTHPREPLPIIVGASGPKAASLAGTLGDGLISTDANREIIKIFEKNGGASKPKYAQITVSYDQNAEKAKRTAHKYWRFTGLPSPLNTELRLPYDFDKASSIVTPDMVTESIVCGPNVEDYLDEIQKYVSAGFDNLYIHQVGPNQDAFF